MADEPTVEGLQAQLLAAQTRIRELNDENKGHRLNRDEARKDAETARAEMERVSKEAADKATASEARATEREKAAQLRAVNASLLVAAKDAGAVDASDVLAVMSRDAIKLNDAGDVTNAAEIVAELKKSKPHLFGVGKTGATEPAPKPADPKKTTDARTMTREEFAAARKTHAWRR